MLRIIQSQDARSVSNYYNEGLSKNDYYTEGEKIEGLWFGEGAKKLELPDTVSKKDFTNIINNYHPKNGIQISSRQKDNRIPGYDFNFHVPKSVSIIQSLTRDKKIIEVFQNSVRASMVEIEKDMEVRVRKDYTQRNRKSQNLIWAEFIHFNARPVDGIPDPHLHAHCYVPNLSYDKVEQQWKAAKFRNIKSNAQYYQAIFHKELATGLQSIGYNLRRTKYCFEIEEVSDELIKQFSRRDQQVKEEIKRKNITNAKIADTVAAKTRSRKNTNLAPDDLHKIYINSLSEHSKNEIVKIKEKIPNNIENYFQNTNHNVDHHSLAKQSIEYSLGHTLERNSTVKKYHILTSSLDHCLLEKVTLNEIKEELSSMINDGEVVSSQVQDTYHLTTPQAIKEEKQLIDIIEQRSKDLPAINPNYRPEFKSLNEQQLIALHSTLTSGDEVQYVLGKAGVGKTTILKEIQQAATQNNLRINAFATTANASRKVLREEGFKQSNTIAALLNDIEVQNSIKGGVCIIDEAGLVGIPTLNKVLTLAKEQKARVILVGDSGQHSSVERGDALQIIENKTTTTPYPITKNMRQKIEKYKQAINLFADGEFESGFDALHSMQSIHEIKSSSERNIKIAKEYVDSIEDKSLNSVLAVSPTHQEKNEITEAIRNELKDRNLLSKKEYELTSLKPTHFTKAQKTQISSYNINHVVRFTSNYETAKRGENLNVIQVKDTLVVQAKDGSTLPLPIKRPDKFKVYSKHAIKLTQGDLIKMTRNGKYKDGKELRNGTIRKIRAIKPSGDIELTNGRIIPHTFRNIEYGYVSTSHASQGLTVDKVIVAQSKVSLPATSGKQAYVSYSRGRKSISIYTDDYQGLKDAVSKKNLVLFASDLDKPRLNLSKNRPPTPRVSKGIKVGL